jgi:hypothetical protein
MTRWRRRSAICSPQGTAFGTALSGSTGAHQEDIMTIVKRLALLFALGAIASHAPAQADALSDSKGDIDAWITTLGGITLSNQPVPSDFPVRLKTILERLPCHSKGEVAKVEGYIHGAINKLQMSHKVKLDYGVNTECRPAPGAKAEKGKPAELKTVARVWIRGYKEYHASMDTDRAGCTKAQVMSPGAKACLGGNTIDKIVVCKGTQVQCCTNNDKGKPTNCAKI